MDTETHQDLHASDAPSPDALSSQPVPAVDPYTIKLLLYAQQAYPEEFASFVRELEDNRVPWSFGDPNFLTRLAVFRRRIESVLKDAGVDEGLLTATVPREVLNSFVTELETATKQEGEVRSVFIHDLVSKYVVALQKEGVALDPKEQESLEKAVSGEYANTLSRVSSPREIPQKIQQVLESGLAAKKLEGGRSLGAIASAKAIAAGGAAALISSSARAAAVREAFAAPVAEKGVFLKLYAHLAQEQPEEDPRELTNQTKALTERLRAFSSGITGEQGATVLPDVSSSGVFFQTFASPGLRRGVAVAADSILALLPQQTRETVVTAVLSRSWERTVEKMTQKLGSEAVSSAPFQQAIEAGNKMFGVRPSAGGFKTMRNVFLDATGTVLGSPDEAVVSFLDLTRINASMPVGHKLFITPHPAPLIARPPTSPSVSQKVIVESFVLRWQHFYLASVLPYVHSQPRYASFLHMDFLSDVGGWVMRLGGKKAVKKTGEGVAAAVAKAGVGVAVKKGLAKLFTSLGLRAVATAVGAVLSGGTSLLVQAAVWVGGKFLGLAWGGIKAAITAPAGLLVRLMSGQGAGTRWQDDLPLLFAAAPVLIIVVLFVFPWFANFPQIAETTRMAALVNGLGGGLSEEEGIPGVSRIPPYNGPAPPPSQITGCPISGGYITQCPGGSFSHGGTDAYDFSGVTHQPVRATHGGYVSSYRAGIPEGQGTGFGNYVRLVGTLPSGERYFTTYAHLSRVSQRVIDAAIALDACRNQPTGCTVGAAALISTGTVLGWVDHTGFSTGPHLHYQYNGPGVLQLPIGCGGFTGTCVAR